MAVTHKEAVVLFNKPGMHEYKGTLYLDFSPPSLLREVEDFEFSPGDVLIATYPRSGTRLLSEISWLIQNDVDITAARRTSHGQRVPFLEHSFGDFNPVKYYQELAPPRLIKTHLPSPFFKLAIEQSVLKVLVMVRDPRDVLVSVYRLYTASPGYVTFKGSWDEFFAIFEAKQIFGGDWFDNMLNWLKYKDRGNVLVVRYEAVLADLKSYIADMATFCGRQLTADQTQLIADYITSDVTDDTAQGEWKKYFSAEQERRFLNLYDKYMSAVSFNSLY